MAPCLALTGWSRALKREFQSRSSAAVLRTLRVPVPRRRAAGAHDLQKGLLSASLPLAVQSLEREVQKTLLSLKEGGIPIIAIPLICGGRAVHVRKSEML